MRRGPTEKEDRSHGPPTSDGEAFANDTVRLEITPIYIDSLIGRSCGVPGDIPLVCLHDVSPLAMGWTNPHLHTFRNEKPKDVQPHTR
jgi:Plasmid pRiA4b ORF-3-like protein.